LSRSLPNTSTFVPNDRSQCLHCVLPIMRCAFGARLDVGLAERRTPRRFVWNQGGRGFVCLVRVGHELRLSRTLQRRSNQRLWLLQCRADTVRVCVHGYMHCATIFAKDGTIKRHCCNFSTCLLTRRIGVQYEGSLAVQSQPQYQRLFYTVQRLFPASSRQNTQEESSILQMLLRYNMTAITP